MANVSGQHPTVIRTERGLSVAGTRVTLYDVMDCVTAGWPPKLIRDRLNLTDQQVTDALAYIDAHRAEVDAEYQQVLQEAEEARRYWEERNRERFERIAATPPDPDRKHLREKLEEWKSRLAAMANDPDIQRELRQIEAEFSVAEADGLAPAPYDNVLNAVGHRLEAQMRKADSNVDDLIAGAAEARVEIAREEFGVSTNE